MQAVQPTHLDGRFAVIALEDGDGVVASATRDVILAKEARGISECTEVPHGSYIRQAPPTMHQRTHQAATRLLVRDGLDLEQHCNKLISSCLVLSSRKHDNLDRPIDAARDASAVGREEGVEMRLGSVREDLHRSVLVEGRPEPISSISFRRTSERGSRLLTDGLLCAETSESMIVSTTSKAMVLKRMMMGARIDAGERLQVPRSEMNSVKCVKRTETIIC